MGNQRRFALIGQGFGSDAFNEAVQDLVGALLVDSAEIDFTYTDATPSISAALIAGSVTFAKLQNADAVSVLGRSANSSGVMDEIAAGANDRILRRTGDALNFGQLTAGMFPNTVVPDAALSSNVALEDAPNVFSVSQRVSLNTNSTTAPPVWIGDSLTTPFSTMFRIVRAGAFNVGLFNTTNSVYTYWAPSASEAYIGTNTNHPFSIYTNDAGPRASFHSDAITLTSTALNFNGATTFTSNVTLTDSDELRLGTGGDLRLYHDGTDSFVDNDTGALNILSAGNLILTAPNGFRTMVLHNGAPNEFTSTATLGIAAAGTAEIGLRDTTNNVEAYFGAFSGGTYYGSKTAHPVQFYASDALRMQIPSTSPGAGGVYLQVHDVDNGALEQVTVGAADSGGSGFKVLRIPN